MNFGVSADGTLGMLDALAVIGKIVSWGVGLEGMGGSATTEAFETCWGAQCLRWYLVCSGL